MGFFTKPITVLTNFNEKSTSNFIEELRDYNNELLPDYNLFFLDYNLFFHNF